MPAFVLPLSPTQNIARITPFSFKNILTTLSVISQTSFCDKSTLYFIVSSTRNFDIWMFNCLFLRLKTSALITRKPFLVIKSGVVLRPWNIYTRTHVYEMVSGIKHTLCSRGKCACARRIGNFNCALSRVQFIHKFVCIQRIWV